jgi:microcystin degradation protein MlrC
MNRVGVLGFLHESNTFLPAPTTYEDFARASLTRGAGMLERWKGGRHELSGMFGGLEESGLTAVPCMATFAVPSGALTEDTYERLVAELLDSVRQNLPVDALLVALHGATVSVPYPDADGEFLRRLRELVGPAMPIVLTLDLHANVSAAMVQHSTALIAYRSNPHLDQEQRGREAARLIARTMRGEVRPVQALEAPPLFVQISRQHTAAEPARSLYAAVQEVMTWPGILSASTAMGFYYADVPEMGTTFVAVADGDVALARRAARWMAERAWARRHEFTGDLPDPAAAVRYAASKGKKPVVLMDVGDNVGGGSPGDSTVLFEELLRQKVPNGLVILYDPESVAQCVAAGVGTEVSLQAGGKSDREQGQPVAVNGRVRTLSDGVYVETEVRHGGWGRYDQGITAVVETPDRHTIVLTSRRMAPMSLQQVISLGIRPERKDILIVKGVVAPRAAYEPVAGEVVLVDTPGVTSDDPRRFTYARRRRPLFPLEADAVYGEDLAQNAEGV